MALAKKERLMSADQRKGGEHGVCKWVMECWQCHSQRPQLFQWGSRQTYLKYVGEVFQRKHGDRRERLDELLREVEKDCGLREASAVWKPWIARGPTGSSDKELGCLWWGPKTSAFWGWERAGWIVSLAMEYGTGVFQVTNTDDDKVYSASLKWSRPYRKVN